MKILKLKTIKCNDMLIVNLMLFNSMQTINIDKSTSIYRAKREKRNSSKNGNKKTKQNPINQHENIVQSNAK